MNLTVYRFEKEGQGVWHSMAIYRARELAGYRHNPGSGPPPTEEFGTELEEFWITAPCSIRDRYHFGFLSVQQLKEWPDMDCPNFLKAMQMVGVNLIKYEVDANLVKCGHKQIVFDKSKAVKVGEYKPLDILTHDAVQ